MPPHFRPELLLPLAVACLMLAICVFMIRSDRLAALMYRERARQHRFIFRKDYPKSEDDFIAGQRGTAWVMVFCLLIIIPFVALAVLGIVH